MRLLPVFVLCLLCSGCGVVDSISKWFDGAPHCDTDNGGCGDHATCQQQENAVLCACVPDYRGDGKSCRPKSAEPVVALTSGSQFTCALKPEGSLYCWGDLSFMNADGSGRSIHATPTLVGEAREWLSLSFAGPLFCGVRKTGALSCWKSSDGESLPMAPADSRASDGQKFVSISPGSSDVCAINAAGELWCWPRYSNAPPERIPSLTPWSSVAFSINARCGIKNDNTLWCWGAGPWRGPTDPNPSKPPVEIDPSRHWSFLAAGVGRLYAIDERGTLLSLNIDSPSAALRVEQVSDALGWTRVAPGSKHLCALRTDGTVWCQGVNLRGESGGDLSAERRDAFVQVKSNRSFESVTVGDYHSCAATASGEVWCWGDNLSSELGDIESTLPALRKVPLSLPAEQIAAGEDASCAIDSAHALWCWGPDGRGGVGDGTGSPQPLPSPIGTGPWRSISTNLGSAGVQENGALWTWGSNSGDPTEWHQPSNAERPPPTKWSTASAGWRTSALDTEGHLWLWLDAGDSQPIEGPWKQFAASSGHLCAIKEDDSLWCLGANRYGQLGDGTYDWNDTDVQPVNAPSSWSAIATGEGRTCGIQTDGTLLCWGRPFLDSSTDLLVPSTVPGTESFHWKAVSLGGEHLCAIREDSTLWCWGDNSSRQLGTRDLPAGSSVPVQVGQDSDWTAVAAATAHTCALRRDGSVWCWGSNDRDQLGDGSNARSEPVQIDFQGE